MNKKRLVFLFGLLLCVTALLSAFGRKEKDTTPARMVVQVSGVVRLTGSEPFTEIVITSSDRGQWYIARDEMYKLYDLQYQTVTVEGEETVMDLMFAGGQSAGKRRELQNIRIIRVN